MLFFIDEDLIGVADSIFFFCSFLYFGGHVLPHLL